MNKNLDAERKEVYYKKRIENEDQKQEGIQR